MSENVLVLIKPDAMSKALVGAILFRLEETKLDLIAAKLTIASDQLARNHYRALKDEPFFDRLILFITGKLTENKKVLALVYRGDGAIKKCRSLAGATNPEDADPKSIRGSLGRVTTKGVYENAVHVSASAEEAEYEIKLWFQPKEILKDIYPFREEEQRINKKVWA